MSKKVSREEFGALVAEGNVLSAITLRALNGQGKRSPWEMDEDIVLLCRAISDLTARVRALEAKAAEE